jgi:predicted nucleotidyltransferase
VDVVKKIVTRTLGTQTSVKVRCIPTQTSPDLTPQIHIDDDDSDAISIDGWRHEDTLGLNTLELEIEVVSSAPSDPNLSASATEWSPLPSPLQAPTPSIEPKLDSSMPAELIDTYSPEEFKNINGLLRECIDANEMPIETKAQQAQIFENLKILLVAFLRKERRVKTFQIERFGSFLTQTEQYKSDMDIHVHLVYTDQVFYPKGYDRDVLQRFRKHLRTDPDITDFSNGQMIYTQKLTLWKTEHLNTDTPIDLVINHPNKTETAKHMLTLIQKTPQSYDVIQLFKTLLRTDNLIAGDKQLLTSYSASILVLTYLKFHPAKNNTIFETLYKMLIHYTKYDAFKKTINYYAKPAELQTCNNICTIICPYDKTNIAKHLKHQTIQKYLIKMRVRLLNRNILKHI